MDKIRIFKLNFDKNIFINCPFDKEYLPMLKTLLYVIKKIGYNPRIALERSDSGEVRLDKIKELIESSKYSIHDLSRIKSKEIGEYSRQNMPFELGLDLGCRDFSSNKDYKSKKILILEEEKYSTHKVLSDLSFADCKCHNGVEEDLVDEVRDWFVENTDIEIPSGSSLWDDYNTFHADLYEDRINNGFKPKDIDRLTIAEFMKYIDRSLS